MSTTQQTRPSPHVDADRPSERTSERTAPDRSRPGDLTAEQVEQIGRELDAIRDGVLAARGEVDAAYIRRVIAVQRSLEIGRGWRTTLAANASAVLVRNVWSHSVIMCGHFPEGVEVFEQPELDEAETRGDWYVLQMLGSASITGPTLLHVLTGHLSHQIEHHCFPDLPSRRYPEVAPQVRAIFDRYGLTYNARPLLQQVASAWRKVVRLSLP